jgi:S-(hydroxymethyl)glutathione dehydrogenase/alcohol dehydrogenase
MKASAGVLRGVGQPWEVAGIELDEPRQNELVVRVAASGLCHSDDHLAKGDFPAAVWPVCAGHEGAGVVEAVGPSTPGWAVGDHVVLSFIPACGRCRFCASGLQNLCGSGARALGGARVDGSYRLHEGGKPVGQSGGISTLSNYTLIDVCSAIKIPDDIPLEVACLVGCGVATGFGSAINSASIEPGDTVIVAGIGGVGINAVQGAVHMGASNVIAVDPVEFKREQALEFGATRAFATMEEAADFGRSVTDWQGADSAIVCIGVTTGEHIAQGFDAIRKGGTVVLAGVGNLAQKGIPVSPSEMAIYQKRLQGALFGAMSPSRDIPRLLQMYQAGNLRLKELVTRTYTLDTLNQGYADMFAGINLRGVLIHDH